MSAQARPAAADLSAESDEPRLQVLVAKLALGDQQALGELYDCTLDRVYGLIMRVLGNAADAEEVVGDLYLQVWERAGDFRPERGCVLAWLRTLAWSRAVDRHRRGRKFANDVELHPDGAHDAYTEWEGGNAESVLMAWSSSEAVRQAFHGLSDIQRQILTLAFHQDMSHQDIAQHTGLPLGTVKSHARRGLAALRQALGGEDSSDV